MNFIKNKITEKKKKIIKLYLNTFYANIALMHYFSEILAKMLN